MPSTHYYNENDPKAAAWLRELMKAGEIPEGHVDERSIVDVRADDLSGYVQCHFFAGIGGWPLALRLAGWPKDRPVWTGSCPCQPFSSAGKQLGTADERHLWPEFQRLLGEWTPPVCFGEQVASAAGRVWLAGIRLNLEALGYAVGAVDLCSASVGAPHIRQRLFWVADSTCGRFGIDGSASGSSRHVDECGAVSGLADASMHGCSEHGREQGIGARGRETQADASECRSISRVENPHGGRLEARCGGQSEGSQREGGDGFAQQRGGDGAGRLAHPEHAERGTELEEVGKGSGRPGLGGSGGMGDAVEPGLERHARDGNDGDQSRRIDTLARGSASTSGSLGAWSAFDLIQCTDGKARRVEPGTFPLAHGVPGRVGLLRGYGNAINPYNAAEFIGAYLDLKREEMI